MPMQSGEFRSSLVLVSHTLLALAHGIQFYYLSDESHLEVLR
jgi:hypothetical protein